MASATTTPFSAVIRELVDELAQAVGSDVTVSRALPDSASDGDLPHVAVLLLGVQPRATVREATSHRTPVDLELLLAVTAAGDQEADVLHDCLRLVDVTAWELDTRPLEPAWWLAADARPRPALRLRVPVLLERELDQGPTVTEVLQVEHDPRDPGESRRAALAE